MSEPRSARAASTGEVRPGEDAASAVPVAAVNEVLKEVVEGAFLPLWIRGEVSDFKKHRSGHWYFTLSDATAQLRCVVWASDQRRIPAAPDEGMELAAFGQLTVYPARGDVQFSIRALHASGDGLWNKALEATRKRLDRDGLLAADRKRPLPALPKCIAVITSPDGAALRDIVHVVHRRSPAVEIVVLPARVQGEGAAEELCAAVRRVSRWKKCDLVIIGRGGGSREDLWCFNDEALARAIAACPVPTISAVGHEVDNSICDLVADHRAATPSAAAEAAVPVTLDVRARVRSQALRLRRCMTHIMRASATDLNQVRNALPQKAARVLQQRDQRLRSLAARINDLSPLAVMSRGFGVATDSAGNTLKRAADFSAGSQFTLHLQDGDVAASVDAVLRREKGGKNVV